MKDIEIFKDEEIKVKNIEIGVLIGEIQYLLDLLEDLREAILCKPSQYQRLLATIQKQLYEVCMRAEYLINSLKKVQGDQQ